VQVRGSGGDAVRRQERQRGQVARLVVERLGELDLQLDEAVDRGVRRQRPGQCEGRRQCGVPAPAVRRPGVRLGGGRPVAQRAVQLAREQLGVPEGVGDSRPVPC
jgi:hypothetical protein